MNFSACWIAAARWSSRLDFRPLVSALDQGPAALARAGAPAAFLRDVGKTSPLEGPSALRIDQPDYPKALLALRRPPPLLWWRGERRVLERPALAIVGARSCTPYGRSTASALAREVAERDATIVSGGARGIDTAAHQGCPRGVLVLGGGLDSGFTPAQRRLHRQVLDAGGVLLSELPPTDPGRRWTFPRRNRLIAALARATVVVEAAEKSGSLYTAEAARELGLEVLAVPGRLGEKASAGCLGLLRSGATCVTSVSDVADRVGQPLSAELVASLPATPLDLAVRLGKTPRAVLAMLALLELRGIVGRMPDGRYGLC